MINFYILSFFWKIKCYFHCIWSFHLIVEEKQYCKINSFSISNINWCKLWHKIYWKTTIAIIFLLLCKSSLNYGGLAHSLLPTLISHSQRYIFSLHWSHWLALQWLYCLWQHSAPHPVAPQKCELCSWLLVSKQLNFISKYSKCWAWKTGKS